MAGISRRKEATSKHATDAKITNTRIKVVNTAHRIENKHSTFLMQKKKKAHFGKAIIGRWTAPKSNSNFHSQKGEENSELSKSSHNLAALAYSMLPCCKIQLMRTSGWVVACLVCGTVCACAHVRTYWGGLDELGYLCWVIKEHCWSHSQTSSLLTIRELPKLACKKAQSCAEWRRANYCSTELLLCSSPIPITRLSSSKSCHLTGFEGLVERPTSYTLRNYIKKKKETNKNKTPRFCPYKSM